MRVTTAYGLIVALGVIFTGFQSPAPSVAHSNEPCTEETVEVSAAQPECGIDIAPDGGIVVGSRRHDPIVLLTVGPADDGPGKGLEIVAKSLVLSPTAPSGRFRLLQTCFEEQPSRNCGFTRLIDLERSDLIPIDGGNRWLGWSPVGRYAATFSDSLYVLDTKTGVTHRYPEKGEHWYINDGSFAWVAEGSFVLTILRCDSCTVERKKRFDLP